MGQELVNVTLKLLFSGSTTTEHYTAFWTILVKYGKKQKITNDYSVGILGNSTQAFASLLYVHYNYTEVAKHYLGEKIYTSNTFYKLGLDPKRYLVL